MNVPPPVNTIKADEAARRQLEDAQAAGAAALDEYAAKTLLRQFDIATPAGQRVNAGKSLLNHSPAFSGPYVLKALSSHAIHKSDKGAVKLNLGSMAEVEKARGEILRNLGDESALTGLLLEEMVGPGVEIVIGGVTDPQFGPMIMVGAGGIYAEIIKDASFRLCPISESDAHEMIGELKMFPILRGARGKEGVDIQSIVQAMLRLGGADGLFTANADLIGEFDLNPLVAKPDGLVALDARIVLNGQKHPLGAVRSAKCAEVFASLFSPKAIAVAGASANGVTSGNRFIRILKQVGYQGQIYPIHPSAGTIEGLNAYKSLASTPTPADYAYLTVPAERVNDVLVGAQGRLKFAQVMANGDGLNHHAWERQLLEAAEAGGFRLIGPNCMGSHSPRGNFTFMEGASLELGTVGIACQSGGLGMDILQRGQNLGLRYSGLVTIGNSIDVQPADLLEFYLEDPQTKVIGMYVEDVKDGRRFCNLVRANRARKPIVLLVGGVTSLGGKAAASHTGAMASDGQAWEALACQSGIILTQTLDEFLNALQICQVMVPKPEPGEPTVTLFGNGGGTSVLATDCLDRAGLTLAVSNEQARQVFDRLNLPPGASVNNPIDLPANVLQQQNGKITATILRIDSDLIKPYATIVHLNVSVIMGYRHVENFLPNLISSVVDLPGSEEERSRRLLVVRSDGSEEADSWKRQFRDQAKGKVPVFDEIPQAVSALSAFRHYEVFRARATAG